MELRPGYRQTEVGVIPEEWHVKPLAQFARVQSGVAKNANIRVVDPICVHYLRVANVQDGFLDLAEMSEIVIERSNLKRFSVLPGDVLMNEGGDRDKLGRGCIWSGEFSPCVHQNHVFVVRCTQQLSPQYLTAWTRSAVAKQYFVNAGSQTTNLASINKTALGQLPVLLPPTKAEQEAIAEALSDADALIESLEQLIAKKRQVKQGAMQELLTGKRRLPSFEIKRDYKQTEVGLIPGDWEAVPIGRAGQVLGGRQRSPHHMGEPCKYLRVANVFDGFIDLEDVLEMPFSAAEKERFLLRAGDVLLNEGQSIELVGRSAIYWGDPQNCCFQNTLVRFRAGRDTTPQFAQHVFRQYLKTGVFASIALQTTSIAHLGAGRLAALKMPLPTKAEQEAITAVLSDMDAEIAALEAKLAKTRQLKQGMMQELLTGRIRLV